MSREESDSPWDRRILLSYQEKNELSKQLSPCPNCDGCATWIDDDGFPDNWHCYCPTCGMQGPTAVTPAEAIESWNNLPCRPGPQTAAVLAELVELLINPSPSDDKPGEWICVVGIRDRDAFLKEQGMKP